MTEAHVEIVGQDAPKAQTEEEAPRSLAGRAIDNIRTGNLDLRVVIGLTIGGIPAVLAAAYLVINLPIEYLRFGVIAVVLYAAIIMFQAAMRGRREHQAEPGTAGVVE